MSLVSAGVEVTVTDDSVYAPTAVATVPLVFIATASDKTNPSGTTASGTIASAVGTAFLVSSQRELTSTFGSPLFYQDSSGTPLHGYEINEYGLMAAYSALAITNRVWIVRADIDLAQLEATATRPTGAPANNTVWLDLADTSWGIFEWDRSARTFTKQDPLIITSTSYLSGGVPLASYGAIGDYAVVTTNTQNPVYYKRYDSTWVLVGSNSWMSSIPTIQAGTTTPSLTIGNSFSINTTTVTISDGTVATLVTAINAAAIDGVTARNVGGRLEIYGSSLAESNGTVADGKIAIANVTGTPLAALQIKDPLTGATITSGTFRVPALQISKHTSVPLWSPSDTATTEPTGSVWIKTTTPDAGADFVVKRYNSLTSVWTTLAVTVQPDTPSIDYALDPAGGGANIAQGSIAVETDPAGGTVSNAAYQLLERKVSGPTKIIGTSATPTFTASHAFKIKVSQVGSSSWTSFYTVTLSGTSASSFVVDTQAAGIPNLECTIETSGKISFTHTKGGSIWFENVTGTPLTSAGITTSTDYIRSYSTGMIGTYWATATYTASSETPTVNPDSGTYWYDNQFDEVDILMHDGSTWKGYHSVTNDARGYDLSTCDPSGPIVSASEPETQTDGTALTYGDLWVDTSDLENYPKLWRYNNVGGVGKWQLIDNTDQTSQNGILFADARWDSAGTTDIVAGDKPSIVTLLTSNYLDIDAPEASLYPRGMLLWNTRRSGGNVKKFSENYFNATDFPDDVLPTVKHTWQNASGNRDDGSPYMGRLAQRQIVVGKLQSAIDTNSQIREEFRSFNLITCPGYPEVITNLVALNNDRKNTAFILGDTPMRLESTSTAIVNWATGGAKDSVTVGDPYVGLYYPAGLTNNPFVTSGNAEIVVPPTHMALRTVIHSDSVSYPWLAPAGTRRGLVDNASNVGYIDATTGEFQIASITEAIRDTLYENKINPVTYIPGTGLTIYGQKTLNPFSSAMDRINVARLVNYIRERLGVVVRPFVFEPNDKITRDEAKAVVESIMTDLIAKRGLYDYLVVCDDTNNTNDRIDRNELYIDVAIEPVKAVEFIYVPIRIKNTGEISAAGL